MVAAYFFCGFATALVLACIGLTAIYISLRRARERKAKIKGYLDLIPDLTGEQRAQVQEIRRVFLPKIEGIRQNMRCKRAELAELLFAEPPDRVGIAAVAARIIEQQAELEHEVIAHILEEQELLSASQRRRFYQIIIEQFSAGGLGVHDVRGGKQGNAIR
jgi:Spy/CpxP family protein refolding chaperone